MSEEKRNSIENLISIWNLIVMARLAINASDNLEEDEKDEFLLPINSVVLKLRNCIDYQWNNE